MRNKKQAVVVAAGRRAPKYDASRFVTLFNQGKTVEQIMKSTGASYPWVRYQLKSQGLITGRGNNNPGAVTRTAPLAITDIGKVLKNGTDMTQFVDVIARAVAQATFSDAQLVPQPITRAEMFTNISNGVKEGVRKLSIGFHQTKK